MLGQDVVEEGVTLRDFDNQPYMVSNQVAAVVIRVVPVQSVLLHHSNFNSYFGNSLTI